MSRKVKKARKALLAFSGLIIGAVGGWFARSDNANFHTVEEFKISPYFTDTGNAEYKPLPPPSPGCGGGGGGSYGGDGCAGSSDDDSGDGGSGNGGGADAGSSVDGV